MPGARGEKWLAGTLDSEQRRRVERVQETLQSTPEEAVPTSSARLGEKRDPPLRSQPSEALPSPVLDTETLSQFPVPPSSRETLHI